MATTDASRIPGDYKLVNHGKDVTATVKTSTAIITQPVSQTVAAGTAVTFSVVASGSPAPACQWRKDNVSINGATSASYSISSATATDAGSYTVVATNASGSVTSNAAMLAVNAAPAPTPTPTPTPTPSGGGGGAPTLWFFAALALLGFGRRLFRRH